MPTSEAGLYQWIGLIMAGYLGLCIVINLCRFGRLEHSSKNLMAHVFDGATFALSLALFAGVMDETVLSLLGSTKIFLLIAGLGGIAYGIKGLA